MTNKSARKLVTKVASKKTLNQNAKAFRLYSDYKKVSDIIERADLALGRKAAFRTNTGSTLNFEINPYGAGSTTAQKI